jgi:uncharacterized SAM-binding protein YcdF (DUF218 family)
MPIPSLLKQALSPGSIGFLLLGLMLWLLLKYLWPRRPRVERLWLAGLASLYLVMGLPWVANELGDRLSPPQAYPDTALASIQQLIVFDGDNRIGRTREASRVWSLAQPSVVHVLGGVWLADALVVAGIPRDRIQLDSGPRTTRAQMEKVQRIVARAGALHTGIIVSRLQLPRTAGLANAANLSVQLVASPVDVEPPRTGIWRFVPTYVGLRASRDALYEHAALGLYAWRGWIVQR